MKKILSAMLLMSFLVLPVFVLADTAADTAAETTAVAAEAGPGTGPPVDMDIIEVLGGLVNWMFYILMIVAALFLVFAGFTYLTASGDPDKVKSAHQSVMWALVGVAVAVMSRGLVALVEKILGVGGA